jgi:hypothetical protein
MVRLPVCLPRIGWTEQVMAAGWITEKREDTVPLSMQREQRHSIKQDGELLE